MTSQTLAQLKATFPWIGQPGPDLPTLRRGQSGGYVKLLQTLLASQGFFHGAVGGNFADLTGQALIHFQQTHLGSNRDTLDVDEMVGNETWWALLNPTGPAQRQMLVNEGVDVKQSDLRRSVQSICMELHNEGVKEIPDGSNTGDGVTRFHRWFGMPPDAWCCMCAVWVLWKANGEKALVKKMAKVSNLWDWAVEQGIAHAVGGSYKPRPSDMFVFIHNNRARTGHIGLAHAISRSGQTNDVYEGNSGNRFALRRRTVGIDDHVGWINPFGDADSAPIFEIGLVEQAEAPTNQTR